MISSTLSALILVSIAAAEGPFGAVATPDELALRDAWVNAKMLQTISTPVAPAGIEVLENHDPVQLNIRNGKPMKLGGANIEQGLYCHAPSHLVVTLPSAAARFEATVGVDSNDQTMPGKGSVVFVVRAGADERFRSPLLREGMTAIPVSVELNGAASLELIVEDGGDGISSDQADWANARVVLEDGKELMLGSLPLRASNPAQASVDEPFSFRYGDRTSRELLREWTSESIERGAGAVARVWTDPVTGLQARLAYSTAPGHATVTWMMTLTNTGSADTPIIEDIRVLDTQFTRGDGSEFVLHHSTGSPYTAVDYEPFATTLEPNKALHIATEGGRGTNTVLPNFNLAWQNTGVIAVLGWPGQWAADVSRDEGRNVQIQAGQEGTHFILHPGESVRTPSVVLQFYTGEWIRGQNLWRQWMLAHNTPRPGGELPPPHMAACSSHWYGEMIRADEASQMMFIDRYLEEKLPLDYWWMDAGWYKHLGDWPSTGTWEVDPARYPRGLRAITDHGRGKGVRSIVWHEPERVHPGTWLYEQHPEWLLGEDGKQKLLNLGDPEARQWAIDHFTKHIREQGIDLYRQDFNIDPLGFWRAHDAPDRQGITEIRYIEGYLAYWDALREAFPNMLIDSCASGGRRNDIETLQRSVPLLRSDFILEPVSQQNHSYGIALWVPLYGTGQRAFDAYTFRSQMTPFLNACYDMRVKDADYESLRRLFGQWQQINRYYYGDYYPLTPYSPDSTQWMGWQFHRADLNEGMIQMFRRGESAYESIRATLRGLDPERAYVVTDMDTGAETTATGASLAHDGYLISITAKPGDVLLTYRATN